jgi:hypothetical protein
MRRALPLAIVLLVAACSSPDNDPASNPTPDPLGSGLRVAQVGNPNASTHPKNAVKPTPAPPGWAGPSVNITGASFLWLDNYDETHDGKSRGTVYVQDVGAPQAYGGMSIYAPSWVPGDLRVAPGDVLDFNGPYEELTSIGTALFPSGQQLPQLAKPVGTFRYEYSVPAPQQIDPHDLENYDKGRQWMSMLVTVPNVTIDVFADDGHGRVTAHTTLDTSENGWTISNELIPIAAGDANKGTGDYAARTTFKSVTGIVTWFYSYHIAPRTKADLVQ